MSEKNINKGIVNFVDEEHGDSIIKVVGVGGGGGNAVNHMFKEGIHKVSFVLCNTDKQALDDSPVPVHLQLGKEGLGAGNRPLKAKAAAEESIDDIKEMFSDGTKMAFITAGMGGGTGTGAAPVIARISKELDILTVGIVTIPFRFEGARKIDQALDGVEEMAKHVDALLVVNNERLREIYPDLTLLDAFGKADDTLSVAAKSIAEIITDCLSMTDLVGGTGFGNQTVVLLNASTFAIVIKKILESKTNILNITVDENAINFPGFTMMRMGSTYYDYQNKKSSPVIPDNKACAIAIDAILSSPSFIFIIRTP